MSDTDAPRPKPTWGAIRRIVELGRPEVKLLLGGTAALLVSSALNLAYPAFVKAIVDGVLSGEGTASIDSAALALLGLFALGGIAAAIRSFLFTVAGERVVASLRKQLYAAVIAQEVAFFDERRTGELTNRLSSDTTVVQNAVTVNVSMALRFLLTGLGALAIMAWTSPKLTGVMLAVVPIVVVGARYYGRFLRSISRDFQDALARSTEVAEETIAGIRTVRAFARERAEQGRYAVAINESFALARRRAKVGAVFGGTASFAGYSAVAAVLWTGGRMLAAGEMSMGTLTAFLLYTFTLAVSLGALAGLWEDFSKAIGASERVFELLDRQPTIATTGKRLEGIDGRVRFDNVAFTYPARPDAPVLRGVTMDLSPGEVVALVGPSGSGKSTVAALLSRFYDPQEGSLSLEGHDFRDLDPDWLRERVGVVSQEPVLFATSIRDNIRYGRPDASADQVEAAARAANAHDFISAFPEGYDTVVGERGVRLSGGQKQRVAIARALLKDPRVLVLDEATSALDAESEHLVQEALERLMEGRTTLVIAHRLSTVREADRVLVMEQGQIVQAGSHDELVAIDGLYRRLVERQFAAA
jgi:ABC transporter fused permease/ATP-binding protein